MRVNNPEWNYTLCYSASANQGQKNAIHIVPHIRHNLTHSFRPLEYEARTEYRGSEQERGWLNGAVMWNNSHAHMIYTLAAHCTSCVCISLFTYRMHTSTWVWECVHVIVFVHVSECWLNLIKFFCLRSSTLHSQFNLLAWQF